MFNNEQEVNKVIRVFVFVNFSPFGERLADRLDSRALLGIYILENFRVFTIETINTLHAI